MKLVFLADRHMWELTVEGSTAVRFDIVRPSKAGDLELCMNYDVRATLGKDQLTDFGYAMMDIETIDAD